MNKRFINGLEIYGKDEGFTKFQVGVMCAALGADVGWLLGVLAVLQSL